MSAKNDIAVIKYGYARDLFEQAAEAVKQCENILWRMETIKRAAERGGCKADARLAEKEIKAYAAKLEKLRMDAFFCAQDVMHHARICSDFGHEVNSPVLDRAQAIIDHTR